MILKLILLVLAVAVVWYGFRFYKRLEAARQELLKRQAEADAKRATPVSAEAIECPRCGTYFATPKPAACGRADCPYKV